MAATTGWGQIGSSPLVWQLAAITNSSLCLAFSGPRGPSLFLVLLVELTRSSVSHFNLGTSQKAIPAKGEGWREWNFSFFSSFFHLTAKLMRWICSWEVRQKAKRELGLYKLESEGETLLLCITAPLPNCKLLDLISFIPARRTSSYNWIKLKDKIRFKSGHTLCRNPIIPSCGAISLLLKLIKSHQVSLSPLASKHILSRYLRK